MGKNSDYMDNLSGVLRTTMLGLPYHNNDRVALGPRDRGKP